MGALFLISKYDAGPKAALTHPWMLSPSVCFVSTACALWRIVINTGNLWFQLLNSLYPYSGSWTLLEKLFFQRMFVFMRLLDTTWRKQKSYKKPSKNWRRKMPFSCRRRLSLWLLTFFILLYIRSLEIHFVHVSLELAPPHICVKIT